MGDERRRFLWHHGVLDWGLGTGIVWSVAMSWVCPFENRSLGGLWVYLAMLPMWLLGGYVGGLFMWRYVRRRQRQRRNGDMDSS